MNSLTSLVLFGAALLLLWGYRRARYLRYEQWKEFPQLPPSIFFGHIAEVVKIYGKGNSSRHVDYVFDDISKSLGNPPFFLLDTRPISRVLCIVTNHSAAESLSRITKTLPYSVPKSASFAYLRPVIGDHSILTNKGEPWKSLRRRFNPGFAPGHMLTLLPLMVEHTMKFLGNLDARAESGEVFELYQHCVDLTFDIMGVVVLNHDFKAQYPVEEQSPIVNNYRKLLATYRDSSGERGWLVLNPEQLFKRRRYGRLADSAIKEAIKEKFQEMKASGASGGRDRSALALAMQDIDELDADILQQIADQIKTFLFAGHDTTSSVLQWALYEISRTPRVLAKVRAELDELFENAQDLADVRRVLEARGEEIIKGMSYTSAVIKELLRLYPPAGASRFVPPGSGIYVKGPDGKDFCLDGLETYSTHYSIHRDPEVYGETANEFIPERWLGDTDTSGAKHGFDAVFAKGAAEKHGEDNTRETRVPISAWRAFERGPRNCIGQELANVELRLIIACAIRRYDFVKVGLGESVLDEKGKPTLDEAGQHKVKENLFQTRQVTAKPVDNMEMRVRMRDVDAGR